MTTVKLRHSRVVPAKPVTCPECGTESINCYLGSYSTFGKTTFADEAGITHYHFNVNDRNCQDYKCVNGHEFKWEFKKLCWCQAAQYSPPPSTYCTCCEG